MFITKIAIATVAIASTTMGVTNLLPADPPALSAQQIQQMQQRQAMNHPPAVDIGQLARAFH